MIRDGFYCATDAFIREQILMKEFGAHVYVNIDYGLK